MLTETQMNSFFFGLAENIALRVFQYLDQAKKLISRPRTQTLFIGLDH